MKCNSLYDLKICFYSVGNKIEESVSVWVKREGYILNSPVYMLLNNRALQLGQGKSYLALRRQHAT